MLGLIAAALLVAPGLRAEQTCLVIDTSEQEVLPGVFLMWDSSFLCADAPPSDSYKITVRVGNNATSVEAVEIKTNTLVEKTPKRRGQTPPGEKTGDTLPITLEPGDSEEFTNASASAGEGGRRQLFPPLCLSHRPLHSLGRRAHDLFS
jgi:hypothetical protein